MADGVGRFRVAAHLQALREHPQDAGAARRGLAGGLCEFLRGGGVVLPQQSVHQHQSVAQCRAVSGDRLTDMGFGGVDVAELETDFPGIDSQLRSRV